MSAIGFDGYARSQIGTSLITKPPKCSFHGDSIALLMGNMEPASPFLQALVRQPRNLYMRKTGSEATNTVGQGNFAVSGKKSGALYAGLNRTSTLVSAEDAGDMNTAARMALIAAYAPDIMIIQVGSNESALAAALDATILNVKDVIACNPNPNKKVLILSPYPKASYDAHVRNFTRWAEQMARVTPGYFFVDYAATAIDESSATGAPLASMSPDGVHPNVASAIKAATLLNNVFDRMGVERTSPRAVSQFDVYNASTAPAGNLLGTKGAFVGTTGTLGGNTSGASGVATGWTSSTTNAELVAVMSKGTLTDRDGRVHTAQIATFSGGPLTADRTFTLSTTTTAPLVVAKEHYAQLLAQLTSVAGCAGAGFYIQSSNGATVTESRMGTKLGRSLSATDLVPTSGTPLDYYLCNPVAIVPDALNTNAFNVFIEVWFVSGSTPAGTVAFAAAGLWPEMTAL